MHLPECYHSHFQQCRRNGFVSELLVPSHFQSRRCPAPGCCLIDVRASAIGVGYKPDAVLITDTQLCIAGYDLVPIVGEQAAESRCGPV